MSVEGRKPRIMRNNRSGGNGGGGGGSGASGNNETRSDKSSNNVDGSGPGSASDDMKISKLLRRLQSETRLQGVLDVCAKLRIAFSDPSNTQYVRRSFDILADNIVCAMETVPIEAEDAVAEIFGLMGFILKNEFPSYKAWIVKTYKNNKHLKVPMMKSLKATLALDINGSLKHFSARLIELLKDFLEAADNARVFLAVLETCVKFSQTFPKDFSQHFTDVVDICIGWHLETEQKAEIRGEVSQLLQNLSPFWRIDMNFTKSLLGQFIEDIESCQDGNASLGSFISAFNTILKCLQPPELVLSILGGEFIQENFIKIISIVKDPMEDCTEDELILPVNEFLQLMLQIFQLLPNFESNLINEITDVIEKEVNNVQKYNLTGIKSLLELSNCYILTLKNDLPLKTIEILINSESKLMQLKFKLNFSRFQSEFIEMFHHILDIKNVSILQEAYKHILTDLQRSLNSLNGEFDIISITSDLNRYEIDEAKVSFNVNLAAIAKIATTSNSIMAMWALQPSICELFGEKLQLYNEIFWSKYPSHNLAALKLFSCHCMKNNNFISSSLLLKSTTEAFSHLSLESSSSPTAKNFQQILSFLCQLSTHIELSGDALFIFLEWCSSIFTQVEMHLEILVKQDDFLAIIKALSQYSLLHGDHVALLCAESLQTLNVISMDLMPDELLKQIGQVACLQMCSVNTQVRSKFSHIFSFLPLRISLKEVTDFTGINKAQAGHIQNLQHWYFSSETKGELKGEFDFFCLNLCLS